MPPGKLFNLARVTSATTGTGTITLGPAVSGFLTFALAGVVNGDIVSYGITDGANSEVGTGLYTAAGTTLTRNVTKSTNADAAINMSGTAHVFVCIRAEDFPVVPASLPPSGTAGGGLTGTYPNPTLAANSVAAAQIADGTIPPSKLTNAAQGTFAGRGYNWGTGPVSYLTLAETLATLGSAGSTVHWSHRPVWHTADGADIDNPGGFYGAIEVQSATGGAAYAGAMIAFHREGSFAAYFGLYRDNTWRVGGWSMGGVSYNIFHAGWIANKAVMESASGTNVPVTPSYTRYHPGVAKVHGYVALDGSVYTGYGISSTGDGGVGIMYIYYATAMHSAYEPIVTGGRVDSFAPAIRVHDQGTGHLAMVVTNADTAALTDVYGYMFAVFGIST